MNNWFVGFAMGLLTLLAYEKLNKDPPPEVDIPITADDIVEAYKSGKKDESPDGPRYKALGNSMAVPVMKWIGRRINDIQQTPSPNQRVAKEKNT